MEENREFRVSEEVTKGKHVGSRAMHVSINDKRGVCCTPESSSWGLLREDGVWGCRSPFMAAGEEEDEEWRRGDEEEDVESERGSRLTMLDQPI